MRCGAMRMGKGDAMIDPQEQAVKHDVPLRGGRERASAWLFLPLLFGLAIAAAIAGAPSGALAASFLERAAQYFEDGDLRAAEVELKNALQRDPNDAEARIMLGKVHLNLGDSRSAEKEFLRARELGYSGQDLDLMLAYARLGQGKFNSVLSDVSEELAIESDIQRDLYVARGEALLGLGKIDEAQAIFDRILQGGPHIGALVSKARIAMALGANAQARQWLDQAAAIDPREPNLVAVDATWYFQERRFEEARDRFALAVRLDPTSLESYIGKVQSQIALGELDEAAALVDDLKRSRPDLPAIVLQDAIVKFLRGNYVEAETAAQRVLAVARTQPQALLVAGQSAYRLGQYEKARVHLGAYLIQNPQDQQTRLVLGATLLQLGQSKEAYAILGPTGDAEVPDSSAYLGALTTAAFGAGDRAAGLKYLERLAATRTDDPAIQEQLGVARGRIGDHEGAAEAFERAIVLAPDRRAPYTRLFAVRLQQELPEQAIAVARQVQTHFPDDAIGDSLLGIGQLANRQPQQARAAFQEALNKEPGNAEAAANLANLMVIEGELPEARAVLDRVLESNPRHLRTLTTSAELAAQAGDDVAAESLWRRAVEADPAAIQPRILLGNFYIRHNRSADALEVAEPALANNPTNLGLLETVGQARQRTGDAAGALAAFKTLASLAPDSAPAHEHLMRTLELNGQIAEALDTANHILTLQPDNLPARFGQVRYLAQLGKLGEARAQLEPLKAEFPDQAEFQLIEGRIAMAEGRGPEAVSAYREAFKTSRNNWTLLELARGLFATGQGDEAVSMMEAWIKDYPQDVLTRMTLAEAQITLGKLPDADRQYEEILDITPKNARALNNLAWVRMSLGNAGEAVTLGRKALALVPDNPSVADTLAVILLEVGEKQEALALLQQARQAAADNVSIQFHFARALAANGHVEGAVSELRSLLGQDKAFQERPQAEALLAQLTR